MKNIKLMVFCLVAAISMLATNAFAVGVDLLSGTSWTGITDNVIATMMPVVAAALGLAGLFIAIRAALRTLKIFSK